MLRVLKELFGAGAGANEAAPGAAVHELQLAAAVLMVEVMRADPQLGPQERTAAVAALRRHFPLPQEELDRILALAEETARTANDFYRFTSAVNEGFDHPQKVQLVEYLWTIALADGHLDAHENHLIAKVAGLLHVTHGEYIAAKLHARQAAGPAA
jgi:uncharacterized tellurite resistance protein B-like protein